MAASREISDGDSHYISFSSPISSGAYTLMLWAKHNGTPALDGLFNIRTSGNGACAIGYFWSSGNGFIMQQQHVVAFSDAAYATELSTSITVTDWHHWAFSWDGSSNRATIHVDGLDRSANGSAGLGAVDNGAVIDIGRTLSTYNAAMNVAYIEFFGRELSTAEIQESMWKPFSFAGADIQAPIWGNDSPEKDLSGNGTTGAINGTCAASSDGPPVSMGSATILTFPTAAVVGGSTVPPLYMHRLQQGMS